jgi:hypothetical protein
MENVVPLQHHIDHVNCPKTPKLWAISHKTAIKHENDEFLAMPLKHVPIVMGLVNRPKTIKLWAIAHEITRKRENRVFFCHASQTSHRPSKSHRNPQKCGQ